MDMKLNISRISVCFLLAVRLFSMAALPAMAVSPGIDLDRKASLNVRILETGSNPPKGVSGGTVELYRLTSVVLNPYSGYYHKACSDYESALTKSELNDLESLSAAQKDALAAKLLTHISANKLSSDAQAVTDAQGNAKFSELELGLYLVVQTKATTWHKAISPFLITLPQYSEDDSAVIYDVDASPKVGTAAPIPTPPPASSPTPAPTPAPKPSGGLPQTGQLWWPAYLLAGAGTVCLLAGLIRRKRSCDE